MFKPCFEFGRGAQSEERAQIERVVERSALVVQHDVVGAGHAHDVVHACGAEQSQQGIHVILIGLGVVGVADVAAHGQAEQFAAEVVFEAGAHDLLAVVQILGSDEADHRVHQHGLEVARDGVGAGLAGLLVDAVMGVGGERAALAGFEVHDVVAEVAALQFAGGLMGFVEQREIHAERCVGGFGAGDRLEDEIDGRAVPHRFHLGGDVREDAALHGDGEV